MELSTSTALTRPIDFYRATFNQTLYLQLGIGKVILGLGGMYCPFVRKKLTSVYNPVVVYGRLPIARFVAVGRCRSSLSSSVLDLTKIIYFIISNETASFDQLLSRSYRFVCVFNNFLVVCARNDHGFRILRDREDLLGFVSVTSGNFRSISYKKYP